MKSTDLADATARVLNILPPGDPAGTDPRLARNPRLAEDARESAETAAAVWLAVSPLRVAPPDVLRDVMEEIQSPAAVKPAVRRNLFPLLAASGWAAAAAIAIVSLWPERLQPTASHAPDESPSSPGKPAENNAPSDTPAPRDARLKKDIARLQDRLAKIQSQPTRETPQVMTLSAPGAVRRTEEESQRYVRKLLTDALRSALEAASGAPSDPATLVIERGWLPGGITTAGDGLIRHRNFPEQDWQAHGLLRSENGDYLDTASQTVWSRDLEGRGFIGRKTAEKEDVSHFTGESGQQATPQKSAPAPEGFVIENPAEKSTEIFVENMPEIPPGKQLILETTNAEGMVKAVPLTQTGTGEIAAVSSSLTIPDHAGPYSLRGGTFLSTNGTVTRSPVSTGNFSTPSTLGDTAYSINIVGYLYGGSLIVNFPSDSIPTEVRLAIGDIIPSGQPPEVILETGP